MIRKGLAAFMICVMSTAGVNADDTANRPQGLIGWLTPARKSSSESSPPTAQSLAKAAKISIFGTQKSSGTDPDGSGTSDEPREAQPKPDVSQLDLIPIELAPQLPNASPVSGPQYFSVSGSSSIAQPVHPGRNWQQYTAPTPVYQSNPGIYSTVSNGLPAGPTSAASHGNGSGAPLNPGTALYPAPVPGIPQQIGGTSVSNQFLHPHEMLYQHRYRALYPPYYYKVNGKWGVTPFGVWSHEDWHLQGTMVDVKYHSRVRPFTFFYPKHRY